MGVPSMIIYFVAFLLMRLGMHTIISLKSLNFEPFREGQSTVARAVSANSGCIISVFKVFGPKISWILS